MTPFVETARELVRGLGIFRGRLLRPREVSHAGTLIEFRHHEFRHHGLGMLQAEITETLRIHIWHPRLVSPGMAWPRCVHDHRFDIVSAVIIGEIFDVPCEVIDLTGGFAVPTDCKAANVYEIEHAKNQDRLVLEKGCSTATSARMLFRAAVRERGENRQFAGQQYDIVRRFFHTTRLRPDQGVAITLIQRSNFDDRLARVLCAPESDVTAISGIVRDESTEHRVLVNSVLREASDAIANLI